MRRRCSCIPPEAEDGVLKYMRISNTVGALLAASLVPALGFCFFSSAVDAGFRGWMIVIAPFVLALTMAHAVLLGLPAFLLLRSLKMLRGWTMVMAGMAIGVIPSLIVSSIRGTQVMDGLAPDDFLGICVLALLGGIGGLSFWLVFQRTSPRY